MDSESDDLKRRDNESGYKKNESDWGKDESDKCYVSLKY